MEVYSLLTENAVDICKLCFRKIRFQNFVVFTAFFCQKISAILRKTEPEKAYFNCHTDITIPYDEIGSISAVSEDGSETVIIENGRFVLAGCEELNKPFLK